MDSQNEANDREDGDMELNLDDIDIIDDEEILPNDEEILPEDDELGNLEDAMESEEELNSEVIPRVTEVEAPSDGMEFDSLKNLENHLCDYARQCGFSIRLRNVKPLRNTNQPPKHIMWICHKGRIQASRSENKMKPRPSQMTGCKARYNAKEDNRKWMYTTVDLEHNHDLIPGDVRYISSYRKISKEVAKRIVVNDEAGIRPAQSYRAEAVRSHGFQNLSYIERDVRNLLQKKRQEKLVGPDFVAMFNYFMRSMRESDKFFFMMDLDSDGRLINVMWVDARSRAAFKEFSDANGFDTTYLKNRYEMSFAPITGINHHGQTILLGCALLSKEDTESFRWLFRNWVDCMGGVAPKAIVTDQSLPITKAIEMEMPNTRHRWCLWHIMEKQNKKFKNYKNFHDIKKAMSNCVYDSMSIDEFELKWVEFVEFYGLHKNKWLNTLYKERRRWVPTFVNACFWAGMSTTQRNESVNSFFKNYVNSKTSLKESVLKYDLALGAKCDKERLLDHQSRHTKYKIVTKFDAEIFFQPIYTHHAFQKLMDEERGCMYTTPSVVKDEVHTCEYNVQDTRSFGDCLIEKRVDYTVKLEKGINYTVDDFCYTQSGDNTNCCSTNNFLDPIVQGGTHTAMMQYFEEIQRSLNCLNGEASASNVAVTSPADNI